MTNLLHSNHALPTSSPVAPIQFTQAGQWPIYLVTDEELCAQTGRSVARTVQLAISGSVNAVQVRHKGSAAQFLDQVEQVCAVLPAGIPCIINDRVDVFLAAKARGLPVHGVHVGQSDLPIGVVRSLIGQDAILGLSISTPDEVHSAEQDAARVDYLGAGPLHATTTKPDAAPALGQTQLERIIARAHLPVIAIGGIKHEHAAVLRTIGASGIAVVSALCTAPDPQSAARELLSEWNRGRPRKANSYESAGVDVY